MLSIPESIKTLYLSDGKANARKNFRVTFPNGEMADITNDSIVAESVKLTESIMSQNTFRFGLAEAPQISFETVGIGNMMGMTIACWHEVETTSLTAADVADIEAGTWDGEYVALADSDLGYAFFRIPLGVFTVTSCPRSHGAMTHRQVKAEGRAITTAGMDAFTRWKLAQMYTSKVWNVDWGFFAPSVYGDTWDMAGKYFDVGSELTASDGVASYDAAGCFRIYFDADSTQPDTTSITSIYYFSGPDTSASTWYHMKVPYKYVSSPSDPLILMSRPNFSKDSLSEAFEQNIDTTISDYLDAHSEFSVLWSSARTTEEGEVDLGSYEACISYIANSVMSKLNWYSSHLATASCYFKFPTEYETGIIACTTRPLMSPYWDSNRYRLPYGISSFRMWLVGAGVNLTVPATDSAEAKFYPLTLKSAYAIDFPTRQLPTTLEQTVDGTKYYGYSNSFSFPKLLTGFFESKGIFGKYNRDGSMLPYTLDTISEATISQDDIRELWWDESDVEPVGSVQVTFLDSSSEQNADAVISLGTGGTSIYNMRDNYYLTKWGTTLSDVTTLLTGDFATNTEVLTWTPTDVTMRGLPWLEVGDWLTFQTGATDVPTVELPLLERTLSGIQVLTDDISVTSGETTDGYASEEEEAT